MEPLKIDFVICNDSENEQRQMQNLVRSVIARDYAGRIDPAFDFHNNGGTAHSRLAFGRHGCLTLLLTDSHMRGLCAAELVADLSRQSRLPPCAIVTDAPMVMKSALIAGGHSGLTANVFGKVEIDALSAFISQSVGTILAGPSHPAAPRGTVLAAHKCE